MYNFKSGNTREMNSYLYGEDAQDDRSENSKATSSVFSQSIDIDKPRNGNEKNQQSELFSTVNHDEARD